MEIVDFVGDRRLRAWSFRHLSPELFVLPLKGQKCGALSRLGITEAEPAFKAKHGSQELLARLEAPGIHPFTDVDRASVV